MPTIKKESAALGKARPRPRPKVSLAKRESAPSRSDALVASTPSPPRCDMRDPTPAESVLYISDSAEEIIPPVQKITKQGRTTGRPMTTRASSGITKKRILEDAAVFSDTEASVALPPSKKQKLNKSRVPVKPSTPRMVAKTPTTRSAARSRPSPVRPVSPLASAFSSADETPSRSVTAELKKQGSQSRAKSSKSSLKFKSAHNLPATKDVTPTTPSPPLSPVPEFEARPHSHFKGQREGGGSPTEWSSSPHSPKKPFKGKARAKVPVEDPQSEDGPEEGDATDEDEQALRRALAASSKYSRTIAKKLGSSSKGASHKGLPSSPPLNSFAAALAKRGVTLVKKTAGSSPGKDVYLDDTNGNRVLSLPSTCQVNRPEIQDVLLEEDYGQLPNLTAGTFRSWNNTPGDGYVMFSGWATQLPNLDFEQVPSFVKNVVILNKFQKRPISPMKLHTVYTSNDLTKSALHAERRLAICLSAILVVECHLLTATDRGLRNKFIKGRLHDQEMQRFVGAACMAFGHGAVLHAQIDRDAMVFSTMGNWRSESNSKTPTASKYIRSDRLLSKSPEKAKVGYARQILDVTDTVPIYDARHHCFDYEKDLDHIESVLPIFGEEIPAGSFAVVAYTMSTFKKGAEWHVNTNVQFVVLVEAFQ